MERYRSLYKENSSISTPSQHSKTNRELQNANRAKKRREIYENIRRISVSPTPKKAIAAEECIDRIKSRNVLEFENKENKKVEKYKPIVESDEPKVIDQTEANKSRIALVATGKGNSEKSTRQEAYLLRFIQWKEAHKLKEQKKLEPKKRPFVSCGGAGGNAFSDSARSVTKETSKAKCKEIASFVPKDHNTFKPPAGLKNTLSKMTSAAKSVINNDRKSFYSVMSTPPRNKQENSINVKKPLVLTKTPVISNLNKTPAITTKTVTKSSNVNSTKVMKIQTAMKNTDTKTPADIALSKKPSGTVPAYSAVFNNPLIKKIPLNKNGESAAKPISNRLNNVAKFARPQPITRKPIARPKLIGTSSNANSAKSSITAGSSGAVGKAHLLQSKRTLAEAKERQNLQCHAKLATSFKPKKVQTSTFNRSNAPSKITVKGKTLLGGKRMSTATTAFAIAETPTDLLNVNPFEAFVTSTRIKSLSPHTTKMPNISPINNEVANANADTVTQKNIRAHSSATAKRALLQNGLKKVPKLQTEQHKFNFIRYSCGRPDSDMSGINEQIEVNTVESKEETVETTAYNQTQQNTILEVKPKKPTHEGDKVQLTNKKIEKQLVQLETPKSNEEERPVNYISSFVSVSRGKVSARKEREKRDSIYLPNVDDSLTILNGVNTDKVETPKTVATPRSVEARRILEAVRYFRQQLQNEIDRLHALCDQWEKYKQENLLLLQKTGGEDMINVTIGQTKLLTSKKFQQFKGLIDRCEDGARGTAAVDDGSEATKSISDVDLEGFWSMLNLQVDNVEKRFENLTRWKDNNWTDPDDVQEIKQPKPKSKPNLNKVKKSKAPAKASLGLQAMLRKMHAEMRKKKENTDANAEAGKDMSIIITPTRQHHRRSQSGTPKISNYADEGRNSTPRCISVVVRDRKSLSAAATVISLPVKSQAISAAAAAQRRLSRIVVESPKSIRACGNELRRSLNGMEKAFGGCNELLRNALAVSAHKARRRSGTPNFIELPIDSERHAVARESTPTKTPSPTPAINIGRKSILKTPGTAKGKPKNVIFNEKLSVKKFKFTIEDDEELSESEEQHLQTSTEDQRTYSLRTRKVVLRPSSEFEIPKA